MEASKWTTLKMRIMGADGCGKTSLLTRYVNNTFTLSPEPTIGIDCKILHKWFGAHPIKLHLWEACGGYKFREVIKTYYKGMDLAVFLYDASDSSTFHHLHTLLEEFIQEGCREDCRAILVATKCDKPHRQVTTEQGRALAQQIGNYWEVSCSCDRTEKWGNGGVECCSVECALDDAVISVLEKHPPLKQRFNMGKVKNHDDHATAPQ